MRRFHFGDRSNPRSTGVLATYPQTKPCSTCDITRTRRGKPKNLGSLPIRNLGQGKAMDQLPKRAASSQRSFWAGLLLDASVAASCIGCSIALMTWIG